MKQSLQTLASYDNRFPPSSCHCPYRGSVYPVLDANALISDSVTQQMKNNLQVTHYTNFPDKKGGHVII